MGLYVSAGVIGCDGKARLSPTVVQGSGKEQQWFKDRFEEHLIQLVRVNGQTRFVTDGFFIADRTGTDHPHDFTLGVGGAFCRPPDHHAAVRLWVRQIDDDGVVVEYESRFNHISFGKNLITIDRGTVRLPWESALAAPGS